MEISNRKNVVKSKMADKQKLRTNVRAIESADTREVHFMFNPGMPIKETPFTRKFKKFLDGSLAEFEAQEHEKFEGYLERYIDDSLDEGETNPVKYEDNKFFEMELNALKKLSFAVADNPFFRANVAKYYPEVHVVNGEGIIIATIGPDSRSTEDFSNLCFAEDFRDDKLKVNDDRKVRFSLPDFKDEETCLFLTVRCFDTRKEFIKEGAHD